MTKLQSRSVLKKQQAECGRDLAGATMRVMLLWDQACRASDSVLLAQYLHSAGGLWEWDWCLRDWHLDATAPCADTAQQLGRAVVIQLKVWSEAGGTGWSRMESGLCCRGIPTVLLWNLQQARWTIALAHPFQWPERMSQWLLILFCQHIIFFFHLLTESCSGLTMEEVTDTSDAVS